MNVSPLHMRLTGWIVAISAAIALVAALATQFRSRPVELRDVLACLDGATPVGLAEIRHPLPRTLFPPDLASPTFRWQDETSGATRWFVRLSFADGSSIERLLADEMCWRIETDLWETIKARTRDDDAVFEVVGVTSRMPCSLLCRAATTFRMSEDEVGAPIFYRDVNLPFIDAVKDPTTIRWRLGTVSSPTQPPVVLEGLPVCGNCHSFSADGKTLGMDVDYANDKGSYALTQVAQHIELTPDSIFSWSEYQREDKTTTFGLLSSVSPDGRHVASTVKDRSIFVPQPDLTFSQLFFPIRGILAIYERETRQFATLAGADDPRYVQSNPVWSPDGRTIVFARAAAQTLPGEDDTRRVLVDQSMSEAFLRGNDRFCYDLYSIPFNGGRGGTAVPLPGASGNGLSNYFPKFSPDGKWLVFCRARSFMLLQPDSELYIIPAEGGEARRLACNTERMNSWHSWSPNGKWLVFASKAETPYTRLFLTHIDNDGNSSPAVLLDRFVVPGRAANIPEFLNAPEGAIVSIRERFLDDYSFFRAGVERHRDGDLAAAIPHFRRALEMDPTNSEAHFRLGFIAAEEGRVDDAITHYRHTLDHCPTFAAACYNLGNILHERGELDEAVEMLRRAAELKPMDPRPLSNLGLVMEDQGRPAEAAREYRAALDRQADNVPARYNLARLTMRMGQIKESIELYTTLTDSNPCSVIALVDLASIYAGVRGEEWRDLDKALALVQRATRATGGRDPSVLRLLASIHNERGENDKCKRVLGEALRLAGAAGDTALVTALESDATRYTP